MRKLIFNLHLYVALIAGAFILILGITGGIMAFEPELDHVMHPHRSYVKPAGTPLSLADLSAKVLKSFPGDRVGLYRLSNEPNMSYQFLLEKGPALYVNQYTGEILEQQGEGMDFLGFVHQLHLRLAWQSQSRTGDKIMSWAGIAMLFLALSGLYLWWPAKRFKISPGASGRRWWFDLHNATGIFSLVFVVVLAFTGVMIGFEKQTVPMFYKLTGSSESEQPKIKVTPAPGATPISPDQVLAIARDAMPGATPFLIFIPRPTSAYQVRLHFPEDLTPGGRSRMLIDQYSGKVLFAESSRTAPAGTRMVIANRAIHTGDILGIPSKTIMSLASLAAAFQAVSGVVMWWKRTRKRRQIEVTKGKIAVSA